MIEWASETRDQNTTAEIAVSDDGLVRLSERFGAGEHRLSAEDVRALRHFIYDEQGFLDIDNESVRQEIEREAENRRRDTEMSGLEFMAAPLMDAGTSVFRGNVDFAPHEVSHYDLVGDAQKYPGAEALQRLRRIELRLLALAETLTTGGGNDELGL